MRTSILILILFFRSYFSLSNCRDQWLRTWPETEKINLNSIFVVEGVFRDKSLLDLNTKYPVYLKSKSDTIRLMLVKMNIGEAGLVQAIFKPYRKLKPNTKYKLVIDNLGYDDLSPRRGKKQEKSTWTTTNIIDSIAPIFFEKPQYLFSSYERMGCGPESHVNFLVIKKDFSDCLIKVKVKNPNNTITDFLIASENDTIIVGHDMCNGAFALKQEGNYEISFGLIDSSGNSIELFDNKLVFVRPKEK